MDKLYNIATFFTFSSVLLLLGAWCISHPETVFAEERVPVCETEYVEPLDVDPLPMSQDKNLAFPYKDHLILIGRIHEGIISIKDKPEGFVWYECGHSYTKEEGEKEALDWSYTIVTAAWEAFGKPEIVTKDYTLFVWGLTGTIYNESRFDRCAIGGFARREGERRGYIKKNRLTKSRDRGQILSFLNSGFSKKYYNNTGIDLGGAQVLSIYKPNRSYDDMLTLDPGVYDDAAEMKRRGDMYNTTRPWLYWRGSKPKKWYDTKVIRWARMLGAKAYEI